MAKKLQDFDINEAVDLYLDRQWTYEMLSQKYGISVPTMWQRMSKHPTIKAFRKHKRDRLDREASGVGAEPRRRVLPTEEQVLAWTNGEDLKVIATRSGVTIHTLQARFTNHPRYNEMKMIRKDHRKEIPSNSKVDRAEAARLFDQENWTLYQLGEKYGVSHQRIQQILSKYHPEVLERRRQRIEQNKQAKAEQDSKKKTTKEALARDYENALSLYKDGLSIRELRSIHSNLNWHTFDLKLAKRRLEDPTFPRERARGSQYWNWVPRMEAAIASSKNYTAAAKLLGLHYGTFMQRVYKMRDAGLLS